MRTRVSTHESQKREPDMLELAVRRCELLTMWVLGTESGSSAKSMSDQLVLIHDELNTLVPSNGRKSTKSK